MLFIGPNLSKSCVCVHLRVPNLGESRHTKHYLEYPLARLPSIKHRQYVALMVATSHVFVVESFQNDVRLRLEC